MLAENRVMHGSGERKRSSDMRTLQCMVQIMTERRMLERDAMRLVLHRTSSTMSASTATLQLAGCFDTPFFWHASHAAALILHCSAHSALASFAAQLVLGPSVSRTKALLPILCGPLVLLWQVAPASLRLCLCT